MDFHQKVVDFLIIKQPELKDCHFNLQVVGEDAPSRFIILAKVLPDSEDKSPTCVSLLLYECSLHNEINKTSTNVTQILRFRKQDDYKSFAMKEEDICHASLSSDQNYLALTLLNKRKTEFKYSCFIINMSNNSVEFETMRLHLSESLNDFSKIKFIQTPTNSNWTKVFFTKNHSFSQLHSTHILIAVANTSIKYQRVLISSKSTLVENENILSSKLHYYELKSELERLYILEKSSDGNFNLKAFGIIWPLSEGKEIKTYEFQLIFSYQIQFPSQQISQYLLNCSFLEHSNGAICFCCELNSKEINDEQNVYSYCVHLINSNNIIECRTPSYITSPPGKLVFTLYKSYIIIFTKYFVHLIDIYCHSKQITNYIWPSNLNEHQFLNIKCLNAVKLSKIYFLQDTKLIISVKPNLRKIAEIIRDSNSVTQKLGALNFIVYNNIRKSKENVPQFAIKCAIYSVSNLFTMSRLMDEYITASINRYLRIKITEERMLKLVDNTTLSSQFSIKMLSFLKPECVITDDDSVKINLKTANKDALVVFVKDNLPNPQINRFLRLTINKNNNLKGSSDKYNPQKIELIFDTNLYSEEPNLPTYLSKLSFSTKDTKDIDRLILEKISNIIKVETGNLQDFIEKIKMCTIRAWKKLLFLIHQVIFDDDDQLWEDLCLLRKPTNKKINHFHCAIGAFRYVLLKEKFSVPASIEEIYILTSYSVLSNERFLIYITYTDFHCLSIISLDIFKEFYKQFLSTGNPLSAEIKDKLLLNMTINTKMMVFSILNKEDKDRVLKEYWDSVHSQTNNFSKRYEEVIQIINQSCDTPQNALSQFYKESSSNGL